MHTEEELIKILRKNILQEMHVVEFFLDHLEELNYAKNKGKIDDLVMDSFEHGKILTKAILHLRQKAGKAIDEKTRQLALTEEQAMREIYRYLQHNIANKRVMTALNKLAQWEARHEKVVKSLS